VKVYSIELLLGIVGCPLLLAVRRAVVHDAPQGARMVARVLGRTPHARDAELAAATLRVVVRTINTPPGVAAADFHAPALPFGVTKRVLDLSLWVRRPRHQQYPI